jgi:hypothetical protein
MDDALIIFVAGPRARDLLAEGVADGASAAYLDMRGARSSQEQGPSAGRNRNGG